MEASRRKQNGTNNGIAGFLLKSSLEKAPDEDIDRITKRSWVEKVTDDSNVWLAAVRLEADGEYEEAAGHFLQDAEQFKERELDSRVALSLLCAGRCMARCGNKMEAQRLYRDAGEFYTKSAERSLEGSPDDATWAFTRAAECFKYGAYTSKASVLEERALKIANANISVHTKNVQRKRKKQTTLHR